MYLLSALTALIPERPATVWESLRLVAQGWGSIFIVIFIIIVTVLILNKVTRKKKDN